MSGRRDTNSTLRSLNYTSVTDRTSGTDQTSNTNHTAVTVDEQTSAQKCDHREDYDSDGSQTLVDFHDDVSCRSSSPVPRPYQHEDDIESLYVEDGEDRQPRSERLVLLSDSDIHTYSPMFRHPNFDLVGIGSQFNINYAGLDTLTSQFSPDLPHHEDFATKKVRSTMIDLHVEAFNEWNVLVGIEHSRNPEAGNPFQLLFNSKHSSTSESGSMQDLEESFRKLSICDSGNVQHGADSEKHHPLRTHDGTRLPAQSSPVKGDPSSSGTSNDNQVIRNEADSSETPHVATEEQNHMRTDFEPRSLLYWHAARGIKCKGQIGRSPEARRLLSDHSFCNRYNSHKLPPACTHCGVVYLEQEAANDHETRFGSRRICPPPDTDAVKAVERIGISNSKYVMIKEALATFRHLNKRTNAQSPVLPSGCDPEHFQGWLELNIPRYIAKSATVFDKARKELSEWYIVFVTLFPRETTPPDPCKYSDGSFSRSIVSPAIVTEPVDSQHCRLLELIELGLRNSASNGFFPSLDEQQLDIFRKIFNDAARLLQSELLKEHSTKKRNKARQTKRKRSIYDHDTMKDSSSDSRSSLTPFTPSTATYGSPDYPVVKRWRQSSSHQAQDPLQEPHYIRTDPNDSEMLVQHPMEDLDFQNLFNPSYTDQSMFNSNTLEHLTLWEPELFHAAGFNNDWLP